MKNKHNYLEKFPYKVGGSLDFDHPAYIVRSADFEIYNALKVGEYCYILNARQTGKSSLRVRTKSKLEQLNIKCGEIDLTGIIGQNSSPQQVYAGIVQELINNFSLDVNCATWWRDRREISPIQCFSEFIDKIILARHSEHFVIFIDEIDRLLNSPVSARDFLALIRYFYDKRTSYSSYKRLTFALLGVAAPSELMGNNLSTPFNIGRAIALNGLQLHEALPLATGLREITNNPQIVLKQILHWTGGQPFLTQKLCQLAIASPAYISEGKEEEFIAELVRSRILENWETQDDPQHLRTIRDRLLESQNSTRILTVYRRILRRGAIAVDKSTEQIELRLAGVAIEQQRELQVYNRIYVNIFNLHWLKTAIATPSLLQILSRWRWLFSFLLAIVGFRYWFPRLHIELNDRGVSSYLAKRYRLAGLYYQCALFLNPNYRKVRYNLGSLYEEWNQSEKAQKEYYLAIQGGVTEAYNNLARLYLLEKRYLEAIALLKEGLQKSEAQTDAVVRYAFLKNLGWALFKEGESVQAEEYLREAIALMTTRAPSYGLLAQVLEAQGRKEEAQVIWGQFLELAPRDPSPEVQAWTLVAP
ncbi:AAA-like domain-containing protein [Spirulina sp. 06S082]|uniref:AAA-like domain-containing protein n=1 Tax=Spirulina sp. 06S082 TaxID=3110248 RepID=UPI002B2032E0|nr:AAA-like domain-containing protein [Spirulina sp. 06S082]MEA5470656.1 AAA-like domain-containing protein [Spirulina sp. 06S082]